MDTTQILNGRTLASEIQQDLRQYIVEHDATPSLAVVLVGDDPASHLYVSLKQKAAHKVGIDVSIYKLPNTSSQEEIIKTIDWLNQDDQIDGILVQLPLPDGIDENEVIDKIDPGKDADGFHPKNLEKLYDNSTDLRPAPAEAVVRLIVSSELFRANSTAVVIANHDIFYKPIKHALDEYHCDTHFVGPDEKENLYELLTKADIVVVAVGRANFITGSYLKEDAIVIDVGTNKKNGKTVGDVDVDSVQNIAGALSPVPGGVGPMTIACLLQNVVTLHRIHTGHKE
ncbi:MAG: bifunctional 5,10-methylenetetrahydrofolate dehydrogenase/5,10-methenyltetrahydrofolate cyclohydrolase [Patescibacteria group bacterium]